ncbi:MAG: FAD-dependent oxidoreductase, partial [Nevskiaceae bacterium]
MTNRRRVAPTVDSRPRFDVIVIGAGSAGLPLAIRAAERGARVLQLEVDLRIGGTLHWSSGLSSMPCAFCSRV